MNIDDLLHHCTEDGDCLIWRRACCNGHPAMRVEQKTKLVRRVLWESANGPILDGKILRVTCGSALCICPSHTELTTYQRVAKQLGALGVMSGPVRSAAIARAKRKTHAILSDAAVADMRSGKEFGYVYAERHGVSAGHVSKIQKHKAWREFSSPFAGLGAR